MSETLTNGNVIKYLAELGYKTLDRDWYEKIDEWEDWYKGKVDTFHKYNQYNGNKLIERNRQTLGMAKKVCEDKANLELNEKVNINHDQELTQEYIKTTLKNNNFWVRGNQLDEIAHALGTGAIVEYIGADKSIKLDYIKAPCIYPLTADNGEIIECAFASDYSDKDGKKTYINIHILKDGKYVIYNKLLNADGKELPLDADMIEEFYSGSRTPLFQTIKPNIVNNYDTTNPMGMSTYGNAIDILKGIDLVYDSYDNEFRLGKKRIIVDSNLIKVDIIDGRNVPIFDDNDTEFYGMPLKETETSIKEIDMTLRADAHETALQNRLNLLSAKCGFGQSYYKFDGSAVKTATEVISENSQLYRTLRKDEIILEKALIDMVGAITFLANAHLGQNLPNGEISINFDDSIIEDTQAESNRAILELQNGIIDNVEYLKRVYKMTEEQAIEFVKKIKERSPEPQQNDNWNMEGDVTSA